MLYLFASWEPLKFCFNCSQLFPELSMGDIKLQKMKQKVVNGSHNSSNVYGIQIHTSMQSATHLPVTRENPEMSKLLHKAVREKRESTYSVYSEREPGPVNVIRDLFEFKSERSLIPVEKVESATSIVERFCTGGMSLGAISREAHEAIAIAMNRICRMELNIF
ncbi:unnamed protein product [Lactuca saligna]|uniref:Glutamate synthase domain-containing protein n=1 Tax=Lactuca saligna TaxID=75948 RepID=A0AA36EAP4_LACSI|nr:unnamed protein product [Lactuca saligna]